MDAIEIEGSQSIEVVAQFDGAIIDVTHLGLAPDDPGRARWLLAVAGAALAFSGGACLCAWGGAALGPGVDVAVALALVGGTGAMLRALGSASQRAARDYTIGGDPRVSCAVAPGAVPLPRFPLVRVDEAGDFELTLTRAMSGSVTIDGVTRPLEAVTRLSALVAGACAERLPAGARAWVRVGGASFHLANVPAPRRQRRPLAIDWRREIYLGSVTLVVSVFLFVVYSLPPDPRALTLDLLHSDRFAHFVVMAPALPPPPPTAAAPATGGSPGQRARAAAGALGLPSSNHRTGALARPGPVSRDKLIASARAAAQDSGILAILRAHEGSHVGAIFGPGNPLGDGAPDLLLGLKGAEPQDGYGSGVDSVGHAPGGGGDGDQTIGAGPLGTVGFCPGCKPGDKSYARAAPVGDLARRAHAPDVTPGSAAVRCGSNASCIDKEIVRRIVRQHRNEVRFCYERALGARPDLAGRVVTSFTIGATGRVLGAAVAESSLADREVEGCIAAAVRRWEFPASSQLAIVSYPFVLTPPR